MREASVTSHFPEKTVCRAGSGTRVKSGNRLKRAVSMALVLVMLIPMLPFNLSVAFAADNDHVVSYGDNQTKGFVKFSEAWDFANSVNGTIDMHADAFLGRQLKLSENHTVTINMNGYMINRGKTDPNNIKKVHDSGGDGTIFYLEKKAKLTINGGTDAESKARTHKGRLISDVWYYDNSGSTVFNGALITGSGSDSYECAAFNVSDHAEVTIKDVNIAGNVSDDYSFLIGHTGGTGAVFKLLSNSAYHDAASDAKVHMENCTIYNNYARSNGAVISVGAHENAKIELIGCKIASNVTDGEGGVIYVSEKSNGASITLTNTWIHDNTAKNGAAIYIEAEGCTIEGGKFEFNHARENGAAIYLYGTENTLRGATIHKNDAKKKGGGVFIYQEDCTLSNCTITENTAKENGGGVFLNSNNIAIVPKTHLSGTLIIKDNTAGGQKNNLFLENPYTYRAALIMGIPDIDSEIWVTSDDKTGVITYIPDSYNDAVFHSDNPNYNVYWGYNENNSAEYRHLIIGTGTSQRIALPGITLKPGIVYEDGDNTADFTYTGINKLEPTQYTYNNWPVYKGYGREDGVKDLGVYYYSDGYFQDDATKYNEHLATLSLRMAAAGYNSGVWADSTGTKWDYKLQPAHVKQMLSDIGVADEDIYLSDTYFVKPEMDSIGCAIGSKKLLDVNGNDSGLVLVPIVVRGAGYEKEWAGNVTLGISGLHQGFNHAAVTILGRLGTYLDNHPDIETKLNEGKVRFWVVGFSRAGATANLLSKMLIDMYQRKHNVIYGYPLEAPQGGVDSEKMEGMDYTTIHNVILPGDLVPNVAMVSMGFQRFGVDHYLPGTAPSLPEKFTKRYYNILAPGGNKDVFMRDNISYTVGSAEYEAQKKIMLRQLAASNPKRMFDDYFHLATAGVASATERQIWHEIGSSDTKVTLENWLADLTYYLNEWLVNGETEEAREFYVSKEQDVLRRLMERVQGGEGLNIDTALDRMKSFTFITGIISIVATPGISLDFIEQRLLNLCMHEKIFADDAIPLTRKQAEEAIDIVCRLLWGDLTFYGNYSHGTTELYKGVKLDEYLIMLPTLIYNADRILQNHMTDVVFAWLRSYDTYYTDNNDRVSDHYFVGLQAEKSEVKQPYLTYELNGETHTLAAGETLTILDTDEFKNMALHNAEKNQGGLIFYDIASNSGKPEKVEKYFSGPEVFSDVFEEKDGKITLKGNSAVIAAKTLWHDTPSDTAYFNIIVERDTHHKVYILKRGEKEKNLESGYDFYCVAEEGDSFTVNMHPEEGWIIIGWSYYIPNGGYPIYGNIDRIAESVSEDMTTLQIKMPDSGFLYNERNLYLLPTWRQRAVYLPVFSVTPGEWDHDISVGISTPAGTREEGFVIKYKMESHSPDYDSEIGTGEYDSPLRLYGSENGPVTWKLTAQAFHEGWLPSSEVTVEYTINYRKRVFTVNVLDGVLTDTGKSVGTFHTGDAVRITASVPEESTFSAWSVYPDTVSLDNLTAANTSFTMPYHDVTVAASFEVPDVPTPIFVEDGEAYNESGEKITEALPGQRVYLIARDPQTDSNGDKTERFTSWTGPESVSFANANHERTTFVMPLLGYPENGVHLKANFQKMFKITVNNGYAKDADGNTVTYALKGEKITITHDAAGNPERVFSKWDFAKAPAEGLDLTQDTVTFTMPGWDVTATAIFRRMYKITVNNGSAKNAVGNAVTYVAEGEKITITPDSTDAEHVFSKWEFSTMPATGLDLTKPTLSFTMPARDITATARFLGVHKVTVINGYAKNAAGNVVTHATAGETITITPSGTDDPRHIFNGWSFATVPAAGLDLTQRALSFTMPDHDVTATADFTGMYQITVTNGHAVNKDGKPVTFAAKDDRITIIPDINDPELIFSKWDFDTVPTGVSDLTRRSLSFTMPDRDVTATAIFHEKMHKISVVNGYAVNTRGGMITSAAAGETITIIPYGINNQEQTFIIWDSVTLPEGLNMSLRSLSFEMPAHDVTATAKFKYTIRVIYGHAEDAFGNTITSAFPGEKITLVADALPEKTIFDHWQVSLGLKSNTFSRNKLLDLILPVASAGSSIDLTDNELIMPDSAVTAEAIYVVVPKTGDNGMPVLWLLLGLGSALCLIRLHGKGRKKETI